MKKTSHKDTTPQREEKPTADGRRFTQIRRQTHPFGALKLAQSRPFTNHQSPITFSDFPSAALRLRDLLSNRFSRVCQSSRLPGADSGSKSR